jgi:hypothetical protein
MTTESINVLKKYGKDETNPTQKSEGFTSTMNKGFHMTFKNGWSISVQWGKGNYCEHGYVGEWGGEMKKEIHHSPDCEIMIWDKDEKPHNFGYDEVKGYCTPEEVADWIYKVSRWDKK